MSAPSTGSPLATLAAGVLLRSVVAGWLVMLLLGVLHHEVAAAVPALAYWPTVAITYLVTCVLAVIGHVVKGAR